MLRAFGNSAKIVLPALAWAQWCFLRLFVENLRAFPSSNDLSNEISFSQIHLLDSTFKQVFTTVPPGTTSQ
jgi:hypothetical protein